MKKYLKNEFRLIINPKNGNIQNSNNTLSSFINFCKEALDKVAPLKQNIPGPTMSFS